MINEIPKKREYLGHKKVERKFSLRQIIKNTLTQTKPKNREEVQLVFSHNAHDLIKTTLNLEDVDVENQDKVSNLLLTLINRDIDQLNKEIFIQVQELVSNLNHSDSSEVNLNDIKKLYRIHLAHFESVLTLEAKENIATTADLEPIIIRI